MPIRIHKQTVVTKKVQNICCSEFIYIITRRKNVMVMLNMKDLNVLLVYMSVSIPKPINEDWRTKLARDDAEQRKIRVKNIARDDKQAEANLIF